MATSKEIYERYTHNKITPRYSEVRWDRGEPKRDYHLIYNNRFFKHKLIEPSLYTSDFGWLDKGKNVEKELAKCNDIIDSLSDIRKSQSIFGIGEVEARVLLALFRIARDYKSWRFNVNDVKTHIIKRTWDGKHRLITEGYTGDVMVKDALQTLADKKLINFSCGSNSSFQRSLSGGITARIFPLFNTVVKSEIEKYEQKMRQERRYNMVKVFVTVLSLFLTAIAAEASVLTLIAK